MKEFYKSLLNPQGKFGIWGIAALIFLGIFLMVVPGLFLGKEDKQGFGDKQGAIYEQKEANYEKPGSISSSLVSLEESLARQAQNILSQVAGVGNVSVSVTLAAGPEQDFARNKSNQQSTIEEKDTGGGMRITGESNEKTEFVFAQGRGEPLLIKEKGSEIKGVLVVAEGAKDVEIKVQLSKAVRSLFDLPAHRVLILPKESR